MYVQLKQYVQTRAGSKARIVGTISTIERVGSNTVCVVCYVVRGIINVIARVVCGVYTVRVYVA